ncbi:MAG: type II secretion system protein [Patescibacteria group bacterium]|jgi:prepilin-type N-terminal cleavage/methylation domain-containing protein
MFLGKKFKFTEQSGLTLVETLLALAIFTLAATYLVSLFPFGLKSAGMAEQETIAINLAQSKIEEIIGSKYSDVPTSVNTENSLTSIDPAFAGFSRITTVTYVDGNLAPSAQDLGLKKINVSVFWRNKLTQATSTTALMTLITNY